MKTFFPFNFTESYVHILCKEYTLWETGVLTTDLHSMRRWSSIMKSAAVFMGFPKEKISMSEP